MKALKHYFGEAERKGWAIGQFNFSNLKTLEAIVMAAKKMRSPVILGTSEGESRSLGLRRAVVLVESYRKETGLPLFLNLDHGKSFMYIKKAIDAGYDSVHFDGSKLPLNKNIKEIKRVKKYAKKSGVLVEGEVGIIGGVSKTKEVATDPKEVLTFLKAAKVDSLAVAVGNLHGMKRSGRNPNLRLKRLKEIKKKANKTPLVLHGGSGTPDRDIKVAMGLGIVKININTELRVAYTKALRKTLRKKEVTPYKYMPEVSQAVQKVVENKIKLFGSKNKI